MLHLQEKAHFSLEEFRRGKGSPLTRHNPSFSPSSPDADDDELAVLGGKTRLVSKKEPSSPVLMERSPISQNPIVPLPLSPGIHDQLPLSVREYLDSFKAPQQQQQLYPQHQHQSSSSHGSYGNPQRSYSSDGTEISPVSIYGMSTLPSPPFQNESGSYMPPQSMQNILQVQQQKSSSSQQQQASSAMDTSGGGQNESNFPQYFPVYDYGLASSSYSSNGTVFSQEPQQQQHTLMLDTNTGTGSSQRRASGSPDTNMQSTWLDFVNTMAM